jgi:hypothetical protein
MIAEIAVDACLPLSRCRRATSNSPQFIARRHVRGNEELIECK